MKRSLALALVGLCILAPTAAAQQADAAVHGGVSFNQPDLVPTKVAKMLRAAKQINTKPYLWGGGHGSFQASGYDCSGSVSFVLNAAGVLRAPQASGPLMSYGKPGPGRWVTIYANSGHVYMTIGKQRFDTIALKQTGARLTSAPANPAGYVARHPVGL